jgi:hypothetical protein
MIKPPCFEYVAPAPFLAGPSQYKFALIANASNGNCYRKHGVPHPPDNGGS